MLPKSKIFFLYKIMKKGDTLIIKKSFILLFNYILSFIKKLLIFILII